MAITIAVTPIDTTGILARSSAGTITLRHVVM